MSPWNRTLCPHNWPEIRAAVLLLHPRTCAVPQARGLITQGIPVYESASACQWPGHQRRVLEGLH